MSQGPQEQDDRATPPDPWAVHIMVQNGMRESEARMILALERIAELLELDIVPEDQDPAEGTLTEAMYSDVPPVPGAILGDVVVTFTWPDADLLAEASDMCMARALEEMTAPDSKEHVTGALEWQKKAAAYRDLARRLMILLPPRQ